MQMKSGKENSQATNLAFIDHEIIKMSKLKENRNNLWIGLLIFLSELVMLYYFWQNNLVLTLSLLALSAIILFGWSNKLERILYFTGFFLGPVYDITLVHTGIWTYGNPILFGLPPWLPISYGVGAVMLFKVGSSIANH